MSSSPEVHPGLFGRLVDDAGLFPPEELSMAAALDRHHRSRARPHPSLTQVFVCPASRLDELSRLLPAEQRVDVSVIVEPTAADDLAIETASRDPRLRIVSLEVRPSWLTLGESALTRHRLHAERVQGSSEPVTIYAEVPLGPGFGEQCEAVRSADAAVKIRCGGVHRELFPSSADLADGLHQVATVNVPFKATAGLHHAVAYTDQQTRFDHFGFLNLMASLNAALGGATHRELVQLLESRDAEELSSLLTPLEGGAIDELRRLFTSFGCCSPQEPIDDLITLGMAQNP